ncbi:MAG: helix-turn-helix domain-containing protein [Verrucomicrobiaceae bacterium]|nr:helix-turn-helix domain-containing protein [Verrucomicrobiaceae bacterium]
MTQQNASSSTNAPALFRPEQLAKLLNVSRRTLTNFVQRRIIPSISVGRVRLFDLEKVKAALEKFEQTEVTR